MKKTFPPRCKGFHRAGNLLWKSRKQRKPVCPLWVGVGSGGGWEWWGLGVVGVGSGGGWEWWGLGVGSGGVGSGGGWWGADVMTGPIGQHCCVFSTFPFLKQAEASVAPFVPCGWCSHNHWSMPCSILPGPNYILRTGGNAPLLLGSQRPSRHKAAPPPPSHLCLPAIIPAVMHRMVGMPHTGPYIGPS